MKRVLGVGVMAALMALGVQSQAEAAVVLNARVCQGGAFCQFFGPTAGPGPITSGIINVGDYQFSGTASSNEDPGGSNSATTANSVKRLTTNNAGNLEIWLTATGYDQPVGPFFNFITTLTGTSSNAVANSTVTYQGWLSNTNAVGFPPPGSVSPGVITCNLTTSTNNCQSPEASMSTAGGNPFSVVTLTTFNVPTVSTAATYTIGGQSSITAVPEPGSMMLLGTGLFGLARVARRRFSQATR